MARSNEKRYILILILMTLLYVLPGVFSPRDFWVEDEARYAEVLREMVHGGEWIVPHLNGTFYPDKPPLYFWLCAAAALIIGKITPAGCMFITLLSALGTVIVTCFFGALLFNRRSGFLGALILLPTLLFLGCAQIVRMDMLLTFFCTAAIYFFYLGYQNRKNSYYTLFYIFTALAVLTKGPFGFSFSFLPAVIFLIQKRAWRTLRQFIFHRGFLLFFLISGGWLVLSWVTGHSDFVRSLFFEQIAGRAVKAFSHREPVYFYLILLPFVFLPWTGFLIRAVRDLRNKSSEGAWLLFWWFIAGFVVISAVSGKLFIYLLPLIPPVTMITGRFFDRLLSDKTLLNRSFQIEGIVAVSFTFGLFGIVPFFARYFPSMQETHFGLLSVIFLPLFAGGIVLSLVKKARWLFVLLLAGMWLFSSVAMLDLVPQINDLVSARQIGESIVQYTNQGNLIATFQVRRGILNFYADQIIPELNAVDLASYFTESNRVLIMKENEYKKQMDQFSQDIRIVSQYEISNEHYVVLIPQETDAI
jgi:4-amino-4-deoxy-L-arabinose transferase-like glycosyltransferase